MADYMHSQATGAYFQTSFQENLHLYRILIFLFFFPFFLFSLFLFSLFSFFYPKIQLQRLVIAVSFPYSLSPVKTQFVIMQVTKSTDLSLKFKNSINCQKISDTLWGWNRADCKKFRNLTTVRVAHRQVIGRRAIIRMTEFCRLCNYPNQRHNGLKKLR